MITALLTMDSAFDWDKQCEYLQNISYDHDFRNFLSMQCLCVEKNAANVYLLKITIQVVKLKGAAQSGSLAQYGQGEKVVKSTKKWLWWLVYGKNFNENNSGQFVSSSQLH